MVVTIVCRDTINCKDTIVLCNGALVYGVWACFVSSLANHSLVGNPITQ